MFEDRAITMSTASMTNFDPTCAHKLINYDSIFDKEKFVAHPMY